MSHEQEPKPQQQENIWPLKLMLEPLRKSRDEQDRKFEDIWRNIVLNEQTAALTIRSGKTRFDIPPTIFLPGIHDEKPAWYEDIERIAEMAAYASSFTFIHNLQQSLSLVRYPHADKRVDFVTQGTTGWEIRIIRSLAHNPEAELFCMPSSTKENPFPESKSFSPYRYQYDDQAMNDFAGFMRGQPNQETRTILRYPNEK